MELLLNDIRLAVRSLARHRSFSLAVIGILALGIAANTTVFSLVYGSLLRPPPFPDAGRLAVIYRTARAPGRDPINIRWSYPRFRRLAELSRTFGALASFGRAEFNLSVEGGDPERVPAEVVSAGYFRTLGIGPVLGAGFLPEDTVAGLRPVVVIGHPIWLRRFGRDSTVIGRTVRVNGEPLVVAGVMPPGFQGLTGRAELWVPNTMAPRVSYAEYLTTPQNFISVAGRLGDNATLDQAQAELEALGRSIAAEFPDEDEVPTAWSATAVPLALARIDPVNRRSVLFLFAAVALLLLLASANVAGLGLARAAGRRQEVVVRLALGASRGRVIRQLMTESGLAGLAGGALGALLAFGLLRVIRPPGSIAGPANMWGTVGDFAANPMNAAVLAFSVLLTLVAVILSGLMPAVHASRTDLAVELRDRAGATASAPRGLQRLQSALVVTEVALALVLAVGAGLLFKSLRRLETYPLGIAPENVLTFGIAPPDPKYGPAEAPALIDRVIESVRGVPGVRSVTVDACAPLGTRCANSTLYVVGRPLPPPGDAPFILRHYVAPEHFATLGIPLVEGRAFSEDDRAGRPRVAIINRIAAERFWPNEDPIGQRVWFGGGSSFDRPDSSAEIVGIVGDVPYHALERGLLPSFYTPYRQFTYAFRTVMVKVDGDPMGFVPSIRSAVRAVDDLPIFEVAALTEVLGESWSRARFNAALMAVFAGAALVLAASGVHGLIAYTVNQRTRELGIRAALGATSGDLVQLVVGRGLTLGLVGVAAGLLLSFALTRVVRSLLFGLEASDPVVYGGQAALLLAVALFASYLPARRATGIDPAAALRAD